MDNTKISLWNPLLTVEAKDVYRHLTNAENNRMWEFGRTCGAMAGIIPFLIFSPIFFLQSFGTGFLLTAIPLGMLVGWFSFAPIRKKGKQILCETEYAKQKGFTPENFRLFIFEKKAVAVK